MGSALEDTFSHRQDGLIPLPSHRGSGVTEAPGCRATAPCWTRMSKSSVTGKYGAACGDGNYRIIASRFLPSLFSATVTSATCVHNKYACWFLRGQQPTAILQSPRRGDSGEHTGSLAEIIKLFLFYTLSSCWCQGLHHLLVS